MQSYDNHKRIDLLHHIILFGLKFILLVVSIWNLVISIGTDNFFNSIIFSLLSIILLLVWYNYRRAALMAQDRVIRLEENFRHYLLTGSPLERSISIQQIIGMRFAEDSEFIELAKKITNTNTSQNEIKRNIKQWREDLYRV